MRERRRLLLAALVVVVAAVAIVLAAGGGSDDDDRGEVAERRAPAATQGPTRWLAVSDVHFDPFAGATTELVDQLAAADPGDWGAILGGVDQPPSGYGSDTNYALLESALESFADVGADAAGVVIAGDFLGHDFEQSYDALASDKSRQAYEAFVDKTIAFLAGAFDAALPNAQFVVTLGNNDSYCGDYESTPRSPFLDGFVSAWEPLVNRGGAAPDFAATFPDLGAYVAELPFAGGRAIVVNAVYWSARYDNACGESGEDPGAEQLAWLREVAGSVPADARPWLVGHIPPGVDVFASQRSGEPVALLQGSDQAGLLRVLNARPWQLVVNGHLHMSTFRLLRDRQTVPFLLVPSISPVFANNPAYYELEVSDRGAVLDYTAYALDLGDEQPTWAREYSFDETYAASGFDGPDVIALGKKLTTQPEMRRDYIRYYNSGSGRGGITPSTFQAFWCGSFALSPAGWAACSRPVREPAARE